MSWLLPVPCFLWWVSRDFAGWSSVFKMRAMTNNWCLLGLRPISVLMRAVRKVAYQCYFLLLGQGQRNCVAMRRGNKEVTQKCLEPAWDGRPQALSIFQKTGRSLFCTETARSSQEWSTAGFFCFETQEDTPFGVCALFCIIGLVTNLCVLVL